LLFFAAKIQLFPYSAKKKEEAAGWAAFGRERED
jgi:hypothetical protein